MIPQCLTLLQLPTLSPGNWTLWLPPHYPHQTRNCEESQNHPVAGGCWTLTQQWLNVVHGGAVKQPQVGLQIIILYILFIIFYLYYIGVIQLYKCSYEILLWQRVRDLAKKDKHKTVLYPFSLLKVKKGVTPVT